jgi:C1A family cysteine protease
VHSTAGPTSSIRSGSGTGQRRTTANLTRPLRDPSKFEIASYYSCNTVAEIKAAIFKFGPVLFGSTWFQSWFQPDPQTGLLPPPDRAVGGHCTCGYGWDDDVEIWDGTRGAFWAANSWGEGWGLNGDFLIPYSQVGSNLAFDEAWKAIDAP